MEGTAFFCPPSKQASALYAIEGVRGGVILIGLLHGVVAREGRVQGGSLRKSARHGSRSSWRNGTWSEDLMPRLCWARPAYRRPGVEITPGCPLAAPAVLGDSLLVESACACGNEWLDPAMQRKIVCNVKRKVAGDNLSGNTPLGGFLEIQIRGFTLCHGVIVHKHQRLRRGAYVHADHQADGLVVQFDNRTGGIDAERLNEGYDNLDGEQGLSRGIQLGQRIDRSRRRGPTGSDTSGWRTVANYE